MLQITAIIPAYNEQISIGSVVLAARNYVDRVLVIDDGSTDRTSEIAELAGAEIIHHEKNMGKGEALKTGFHAAEDSDILVTIDGDGQHKTSEIPNIIQPIIDGEADIVNGSRYLKAGEKTPRHTDVWVKMSLI